MLSPVSNCIGDVEFLQKYDKNAIFYNSITKRTVLWFIADGFYFIIWWNCTNFAVRSGFSAAFKHIQI